MPRTWPMPSCIYASLSSSPPFQDGLGLAEQLDAAREAVRERAEDVANAQLQVQRLDAAHRALRDEIDGDMRTVGEQADKIKVGGGRCWGR